MPEELTCPQCQGAMAERHVAEVTVHQCSSWQGIFLGHAELPHLVEAETDYHRDNGPVTRPMPRITPDMVAPPPTSPASRSFIEKLFD